MAARLEQLRQDDEQGQDAPPARRSAPASGSKPKQVNDNVMLAQLAREGWGEYVTTGG